MSSKGTDWDTPFLFLKGPSKIFDKGERIMYKSKIIKLAGVSYGDCQENIKQFGCRDIGNYALIREPDNTHDPNAIKISLVGIWDMGYLPRDLSKELAPLMDAGRVFDAEFVCRNSHPNESLIGLTVKIVETTSN